MKRSNLYRCFFLLGKVCLLVQSNKKRILLTIFMLINHTHAWKASLRYAVKALISSSSIPLSSISFTTSRMVVSSKAFTAEKNSIRILCLMMYLSDFFTHLPFKSMINDINTAARHFNVTHIYFYYLQHDLF